MKDCEYMKKHVTVCVNVHSMRCSCGSGVIRCGGCGVCPNANLNANANSNPDPNPNHGGGTLTLNPDRTRNPNRNCNPAP